MAHVVRPQGRVGLTYRAETEVLGTSHLQSSGGGLILVSEDFYEDFAQAAADLRDRMSRQEFAKRLSNPYLAIPRPKVEDGR
jgi:hypothetical protein